MFINSQRFYNHELRASIDDAVRKEQLKVHGSPAYYTCLLMDGLKLNNIIKCYSNAPNMSIANKDLDAFIKCCFYVGKGTNDRKLQHAILGKKIFTKQLPFGKISAKFSKIAQLWENGHGITVLQLFNESTHYEAHAREFAMIKSIGINNITNVVNGTMYNVWCYENMESY